MDAAISGSARVALLVDDDGLASIHLDAPGELIPRQPAEYWLLFGDAHDIEFAESVDRSEVERRLAAAARRDRALHHASILLDGSWSGETRMRASAELNELLATREIREYVENVLYSVPLPEGVSVQSALLHCVGTRARDLLGALVRAQTGIVRAREAWDEATISVIDSPKGRATARAQAVKSGLFPMMVAAQERPEQLQSLKQRAPDSPFGGVPQAEQLIAEWAAPLELAWRRFGEVAETYWGYLTTLRSPQPRRRERTQLPVLAWPKADDASEASPGLEAAFDDQHRKAVARANAALDRTGKRLRRRQLFVRLLRAATGLSIGATAGTLSVVLAIAVTLEVEIDLTRWLLVIAIAALAAGAFWLLDRVFKPSAGWVRTIHEYQIMQAAREEFELEWARRLSPVARRVTLESGSVEAIDETAAAFMQRLEVIDARGREETRAPVPTGGLRIVVENVEALADRAFSVTVADRTAFYSGTNSVALILPEGHYVVVVSATSDRVDVRAELAAIVMADQTAEVCTRL